MSMRNIRQKCHPLDDNLFWCPKCQNYLFRDRFYTSTVKKCGVSTHCIECSREGSRERARKVYLIKPDIYRDAAKRYRANHQEKIKKEKKEWAVKNRERLNEKMRQRNKLKRIKDGYIERVKTISLKNANKEKWRKWDYEKVKIYSQKKYYENIELSREMGRKEYYHHRDQKLGKKRQHINELSDFYIKRQLKRQGIQVFTTEIIELKRQQLFMIRTLREFKKWRKDNESNHVDVYGE